MTTASRFFLVCIISLAWTGSAHSQTSLGNGQERLDSFLAGQARSYSITVNSPGTIMVSVGERGATLPAEPTLELFDPNGNRVDSDFGGLETSEAEVQVNATLTGVYTAIVAERFDDESLSYRIRALVIPGNPQILGSRDRELVSGEEFLGSFPLGTFAVFPIDVDSTGTVIVSVGELGNDRFSEPTIQLFDPDGFRVDSDFGGLETSEAKVQVVVDQPGTFTAVVQERFNDEPLEFRVRALVIPDDPIAVRDQDLASGEEFLGSFPLGSFATFPIEADSTGTIIVSVGEVGPGFGSEPTLQLFDPNGVRVDSDFGGLETSAANVQVFAEVPGTYTAVVEEGSNDEPLEYRVRALVIPSDPIAVRDQDLASGEEFLGSFPLGSFATFPIEADSTGTIIVSVGEVGPGFGSEPTLQLFDPNGVRVDSDFGGLETSEANVQVFAEVPGTYTAVVEERFNDEPLDYRVRALVIPSVPQGLPGRDKLLASGEEFLGQFPLGSFSVFSININEVGALLVSVGETGEELLSEPTLQLFDPSGVRLDSDFGGLTTSEASSVVTISELGTYTLVVQERFNDESLQFRIRATSFPSNVELVQSRDECLQSGLTYSAAIPLGGHAIYPLDVSEPGFVQVDVMETGDLSAEPNIRVYDPNGILVDSDFGGLNTSDADAAFNATTAGVHWVEVNDRNWDEPMEFDITAIYPGFSAPNLLTPIRGVPVSGSEIDLKLSDNSDHSMRRNGADLQGRIQFEVEGVSPVANPTEFDVTLEGAVFARSTVVQTVELFDFDSQSWVVVDSRNARRFIDSTATVSATGNLSRFVEAGTLSIRARVEYRSVARRQQFSANTDRFVWRIAN